MTPQEKWNRLNNPQSAEDYGLSMTEAELEQVPEAFYILEFVRARRKAIKQSDVGGTVDVS